jgi:hypothetical protein
MRRAVSVGHRGAETADPYLVPPGFFRFTSGGEKAAWRLTDVPQSGLWQRQESASRLSGELLARTGPVQLSWRCDT